MMITSLQNLRVKEAVKLRGRRDRDKTGLFLIEGFRELLRAVDAGIDVQTLFFCPEFFLGTNETALIERSGAEQVLQCNESVFAKMSYRDRPDGLLAIAKKRSLSLEEFGESLGDNPFIVVAEAIEKPGNLGTILRSSDAVGADGVIVSDRCTDIFNPNVVRASVGTLFTVPVVEAKGDEVLAFLRERGVTIVASTPSAEVEYTKVDLKGPVAIAIGTEQLGLSEKWLESADLKVKLPMLGVADSLNAAMATSVLLYEVLRQRSDG